jgi:hypothetical protein
MEIYVNDDWTVAYGPSYVAEALAWSDSGNHVTVYAVGPSAQRANEKLHAGLAELGLLKRPKEKIR